MTQTVRIGVIGAGNFTRQRHLPNFTKLPDVEVVAVCNRTPETVQKVAADFNISRATTDWREIISASDIDAVVIGTPPYFHHQATMAALDAGKHVFSEARMATNVKDARAMLKKAQDTGLKTMLAPTILFMRGHRFIKKLLDEGYVGNVGQVFGYWFVPNYADRTAPLHRRQDSRNFGAINPLFLGPFWERFRPLFGDAQRLLAQTKVYAPQRLDKPGGTPLTIDMPDAITAIAEVDNGAVATCVQSGVAHFGRNRMEVYGDQGTIVYYADNDEIVGAQKGDSGLGALAIPPELEETWQVEVDFIRLVRGEIEEAHPNFAEGVKNTEFLEAAHISAQEGRWVNLPLP